MSLKTDIAVSVRDLSKVYTIAHYDERRVTLAEQMLHRLKNPFKHAETEIFWALKNVNFDIKKGDVVGIIGRNGAGKSTLLKILSRITEPTAGEIRLYGRVGSLLEVGTGFHPELTGRENIYLNGQILGMRKKEIDKQFDAIVDFAGVEKFLDTPVKRYSSGMYVRLAFAVAAHLESEILVVDEVLAVGDAEFQNKCLGKMRDVAGNGRTVLFVSHNMNAVQALCKSVLHLKEGTVLNFTANVTSGIQHYLVADEHSRSAEWSNPGGVSFANPWFTPHRFFAADAAGQPLTASIAHDEQAFIHIEGIVEDYDNAVQVGYALFDSVGTLLYWTAQTDRPRDHWPRLSKGICHLYSPLPPCLCNEGDYRIELLISLYHRQWICCPGTNAPTITIQVEGGLTKSPYWSQRRPGILAPICPWYMFDGNVYHDKSTIGSTIP